MGGQAAVIAEAVVEPPRQLMEASEVARVLGMSYSGVYLLFQRGELRPVAITARGLRLFDPVKVEELRQLRAKRKEGTPVSK